MIIPGPEYVTTKKVQLASASKIITVKRDDAYEIVGVGCKVDGFTVGDTIVTHYPPPQFNVGKELFFMVHKDTILGKVVEQNA